MIIIRKSQERGQTEIDWLKSYHSFSFGDYYDPEFMGFQSLRVINEDWIAPGQGFGFHPHQNMEIITYIVAGELEHKDSMGTGSVIRPGEIQAMSAGTGVRHSEFNHSLKEKVHLLQIWIIPKTQGLVPQYQQKSISKVKNQLNLIASGSDKEGIIKIHQEADLYCADLDKDQSISFDFQNSKGWLQLISGRLDLNGNLLEAGDGVAISSENLVIKAHENAHFLLFDLRN